jgi:hypothetical protein
LELSGEFAYLNGLVWMSRFEAEIGDKE